MTASLHVTGLVPSRGFTNELRACFEDAVDVLGDINDSVCFLFHFALRISSNVANASAGGFGQVFYNC